MDITSLFQSYLASNRGLVIGRPHVRRSPDYDVSARLHGSTIELSLTFRTGSAYCCTEWGCHLNLADGKRWERLRREMAGVGLEPADRLRLQLRVTVEEGAQFFDFSRPDPERRGWYEFAPAQAQEYRVDVTEGAVP